MMSVDILIFCKLFTVGGDVPKLHQALAEILDIATHWKTIGIFLEIPKHTLDSIKSNGDMANDHLIEMLSLWLKTVHPRPSWNVLVNAVKRVDTNIAERINAKYCRVTSPRHLSRNTETAV